MELDSRLMRAADILPLSHGVTAIQDPWLGFGWNFAQLGILAAIAVICVLAYSAVGVTYWRLTQGFWRVTSAWELLPIYLPSTAWHFGSWAW